MRDLLSETAVRTGDQCSESPIQEGKATATRALVLGELRSGSPRVAKIWTDSAYRGLKE